jgi:hypothetical protein
MRPIIFILCATHAEAQQIAAAHQLDNWRFLGDASIIRGFRQPKVWRTPCWSYGHPSFEERHEIRMAIAATEAETKRIDCLHGGRIPAADNA